MINGQNKGRIILTPAVFSHRLKAERLLRSLFVLNQHQFHLRNAESYLAMMSPNNTISAVANNRSQGRPTLEVLMEPTWVLIIRLTVECLIALAGVIGNIVVCYAITKHRTLSAAAPNTYIRNVAVSDLATLLISFPLVVVRERLPYWPLGEVVCRFLFPSIDIFFGVSVWTVAAIAIDRHRILTTDVPRLTVSRSLTKPRLVCAVIWLLSFLVISLPLILVFEYREFPNKKTNVCCKLGTGKLLAGDRLSYFGLSGNVCSSTERNCDYILHHQAKAL